MSVPNFVENVPLEILETILYYTATEDLSTLANEGSTWSEAAMREKAKRIDILLMYVPLCSNAAKTLPRNLSASLFFYDDELESSFPPHFSDMYDIEKTLLDDFKQLPGKQIMMKLSKCLTAEIEFQAPTMMPYEFNSLHETFNSTNNASILGNFFPNLEGQNGVRVACIRSSLCEPLLSSSAEEIDGIVNDCVEELGMTDHKYRKSTLIVFTNAGRDRSGIVLLRRLHKRAAESGEELTCNIVCGRRLAVGNHNGNSYTDTKIGLVAMRLFGRSVESWSTHICYLSKGFEIERKLQELKARVKTRRHSVGLISSPVCSQEGCSKCLERPCGNCYELMSYVKRIFSSVPFVGLFNQEHPWTDRVYPEVKDDNLDFYGGNESDFNILYLYTKVIIIAFD